MTRLPNGSFAASAFLTGVPTVGLLILAWSLGHLLLSPPQPYWLAFALLTLLTASFTVKIPGLVARLSVSEPFVLASALLFGPAAGAITAALDGLAMSLRLLPHLKTPHRVLFNVGVLVLSVFTSSHLFFALFTLDPMEPLYSSLSDFLLPLYAFAFSCFLINSSLIATALAIERSQPFYDIWRRQFLWLSLNSLSGASLGALIVLYARSIDFAVFGIVVPLLAISYLTFRTVLGRLEDTSRHLATVNRLYISTIETLAMAVDAKDQVTHGHIRRVQQYTLGLARALGVTSLQQLQALEAAALLHDMGKLAIPEFILNKPGRLTPSEFERMKLHASIGADLLSAIEFPYPVVPIVRHHHENWDGSGYPDGLTHTEIPIGARILAVADCFDALTSDRPYRPALTRDAALQVILERRGTMYDPLVVDAFLDVLPSLSPRHAPSPPDPRSETMRAIARLHGHSPYDEPNTADNLPTAHLKTVLPLFALLGSISKHFDPDDLAVLLLARVDDIVPADACVLFLTGPSSATIVGAGKAGVAPRSVVGTVVPFGTRIAGWVAANRISVRNGDPRLDFGAAAGALVSTLAVPLLHEGSVSGVLAFYSQQPDIYTSAHQRFIEILAGQVAALYAPTDGGFTFVHSKPTSADCHEWLSWVDLERVLSVDVSFRKTWRPLALLSVRCESNNPDVCKALAASLCKVLRLGDLAFRIDDHEFLVLLPRSPVGDAIVIADTLARTVAAFELAAGFEVATAVCGFEESLVEVIQLIRRRAGSSVPIAASTSATGLDSVH